MGIIQEFVDKILVTSESFTLLGKRSVYRVMQSQYGNARLVYHTRRKTPGFSPGDIRRMAAI